MLTREHSPQNVKRNEEAINYTAAVGAIDLSGISDAPTKAAMEKLLVMVKAVHEISKRVLK